jgi:hypothetical protein
MKPKPLESLNHFTVPVAILNLLKNIQRGLAPNLGDGQDGKMMKGEIPK